jgi:hypothetical protein
MNMEWVEDTYNNLDIDLMVHAPGLTNNNRNNHLRLDWITLAFIRPSGGLLICRFWPMKDGEFPDGKAYKTMRAAKRFCEKHAPAMWVLFQSQMRS